MPKPTDNIEVLREDQEKINKFSRLNGQLTEVDQMIEQRTKIVKVIKCSLSPFECVFFY